MKILWITNTLFPDAAIALGKAPPVVGGWMYGLAKDLSESNVTLTVATVTNFGKDEQVYVAGIQYYLLQSNKPKTFYDQSLVPKWQKLIETVAPDLVHIHGTEYAQGLSLLKAYPKMKHVISIQGLIGVIARYYTAGIPTKQIVKNITFRDVLKRDTILHAQSSFYKRARLVEKVYLQNAKHIIGRTQWDKDHISTMAPKAAYYHADESLRDIFYTSKKWDLNNAAPHTIFLSQAGYPIKGLHMVLKAVALLKPFYPNLQVRIAGGNILMNDAGFKKKLKRKGYGKYIQSIIDTNDLEKNVSFLGFLKSEQMVGEYLKSHVFICPSSIENSPNSVGEAQLLGVPTIASYVGGVPTFITDGETGLLYRFEEVEMLASCMRNLFENNDLARSLSEKEIEVATKRHHRQNNCKRLFQVYEQILNVS